MANKFPISTGFYYFVKREQVLELLQHQSMGSIVVKINSSTQILYQELIEVKETVKMSHYVSIPLKLINL